MLRYHVPYKEDSWDPARSSPGFILIQKNIYKYVDVLAVSCREIKSPQSEANPYSWYISIQTTYLISNSRTFGKFLAGSYLEQTHPCFIRTLQNLQNTFEKSYYQHARRRLFLHTREHLFMHKQILIQVVTSPDWWEGVK